MFLHPTSLLECVEAMTAQQRARLCELLDPVTPNDSRQERAAAMQAQIEAAVFGPEGPQGPEFEDKTHFLTIVGVHRVPDPGFVFRPPSPDLAAKFLYRQLTGENLVVPPPARTVPQILADNVKYMLASMPPEVIKPADDDTLVMAPKSAQLSPHHTRWMNARDRWQQLFGETEIPMVRRPQAIADDLDLIEGMLYDKGVKNQDPARCSCGCGYVAGCGSTKGIHNIED